MNTQHPDQVTHTRSDLTRTAFDAAEQAVARLSDVVPDLDRDHTAYALVSVLLEEAWISGR